MEYTNHDAELALASPDREKRTPLGVVTPYDNDDDGRKKRKTTYKFVKSEEVTPKNLMANACEAYMISLRGNIDLFYFEQGQTEAYVNPLVELLTTEKSDMHNWRVHKEQLTKMSKIIAVVPRRVSRAEDEPEWKFVATKLDPNAKFKKHYFVSYDDTGATKESKKERLEAMLKFLEQYHRRGPNPYNTRMYHTSDARKLFVLPEDYDQTPSEPERWDERILDIDIARIMRMIMEPKPSRNFAKEAFEVADNFYTPPYNKIAQEQFGYGPSD